MKKTRWMLIATLLLMVAGLGFGLIGAYSKISVRAEGSVIPKVIDYLPEDSEVVAFVDVRKLVYSPAYQAFEKEHGHKFTYKLQEFIQETGLDPRQDLDSVAFAARAGVWHGSAVAIVTGSYDQDKIVSLLTTKAQATVSYYRGRTLYSNPHKRAHDPDRQEVAAFLDPTNLVFGELEAVQQTIDARVGSRQGVTMNTSIRQLLEQTRTDGTFWLVSSRADFMSHLHKSGAPRQVQQNVPQIQNFILDGDLGNIVTASLRSQCSDEKAAQNLSEFARGLVALGKMVTAQRPELAGLFEDIRVSQNKTLVSVEFSIPFEDLKKLQNLDNRQGLAEAIKVFD